jgi:diaminopimelate decarboxylase
VPENPLAPDWLIQPADANALVPKVWSRNAARTPDGQLAIAGALASSLAAEFGTPLYVVDEIDARSRAAEIKDAFDTAMTAIGTTAKVYYAGKAFLCTEIVRWMDAAGLGVDVASGGELAVAVAAGLDPKRIGVHGNNKSEREIEAAVAVGVGAIVLDSVVEIERVIAAARRRGVIQPVRLRINSGVHASTHEYLATAHEDQKFGVPMSEAPRLVQAIRSSGSLQFLGLHSHIGSQIFESDGFGEAARRLMALHSQLLEGGPVPELNLGGGFGIAYTSADEPRPIRDIAQRIAVALVAAAKDLGIEVPVIAIEPGRSIIGPAATTLYRVGTVKPVAVEVPGGSAVRTYVSVDGGMSDNIRPALYRADYSARIANRSTLAAPSLVRIAGMHCESGDIVVRDEYLPGDVAPGDLVAVPATGAYGWAMANNYNWVSRPAVVAVRDGAARIIVKGETIEDLLRRDPGVGR